MIEKLTEQEGGDGGGGDRQERVDDCPMTGILGSRYGGIERGPVDPQKEGA